MPLSQISWPFMAQAIAALLIAWNLKRKENRPVENLPCPICPDIIKRLDKGEQKFERFDLNINELKTHIAVVISKLEGITDQVRQNREAITGQYRQILKKLE